MSFTLEDNPRPPETGPLAAVGVAPPPPAGRPVFVSETGRRARYLRWFGRLVAVVICLWLVALAASAIGFRPLSGLPGIESPSAQRGPGDALRQALQEVQARRAAAAASAPGPVRPASTHRERDGSGARPAHGTAKGGTPNSATARHTPVRKGSSGVRSNSPSSTRAPAPPRSRGKALGTVKAQPAPSRQGTAPATSGRESAPGQVRKGATVPSTGTTGALHGRSAAQALSAATG